MMWGPLVSQGEGERELAKSSKGRRQLGLAVARSDLAVLEGEKG